MLAYSRGAACRTLFLFIGRQDRTCRFVRRNDAILVGSQEMTPKGGRLEKKRAPVTGLSTTDVFQTRK